MIRPRQRPWFIDRLHERMPPTPPPAYIMIDGLYTKDELAAYGQQWAKKVEPPEPIRFWRNVFSWSWL